MSDHAHDRNRGRGATDLKSGPVLISALFAVTAVASCTTEEVPVYPEQDWPTADPASQGVDASVLDALDAEFASGQHGYIDGMLVIRNGAVVYRRQYARDYDTPFQGRDQVRGPYNYYDPDWHPWLERGPLHTMQSVSKSVTSALVGIAIRRGEISGVDIPVARFFDDAGPANPDPRWRAMTLRHLLTMTAGIEWDETTVPYTDPGNTCAAMEQSADWVRFVLGRPMRHSPGERFEYSSGVTMLLAHILVRATGRSLADYAREQLFEPLGIRRFYWKQSPTGLHDAEGGLYLTAEDLARFGYLHAQDGVWNGRRILPEGWVAQTMDPATRVPGWNGRYGYQWWLLPMAERQDRHAWAAIGFGGQRLLVVPERGLVAVFTGWNIYEQPALDAEFALRRVLQALR